MTRPAILCVDDQSEVLESVLRDIESFEEHFDIYDCDSPDDARAVLEECDVNGVPVALIISDHVMPDETGVDFLASVHRDGRFAVTRKLLLTGLATHEDTIRAINEAKIDQYIPKPWDPEKVKSTMRVLLSRAIHDLDLNFADFSGSMDPETVLLLSR
jgi:two-component system chemotaxis response regulator CheY